jgi:CENP-Q, a CENPA-CAD centromere complex subunit
VDQDGGQAEDNAPTAKRKRGRPSLSGAPESATRRHDRPSTSGDNAVEERDTDEESQSLEDNMAIVQHYNTILARCHPRLIPKERTLSKSEIDEKWAPLAGRALEAAAEMLVPAGHATINALPLGSTRRKHTEAAIAGIQRRLMAYTTKMPFPPSWSGMRRKGRRRGAPPDEHEPEFDYEYMYDRTMDLQAQLDAAQSAVEVLQRERDREERELERDYKMAQNLEAAARAEKRDAREMVKRAHVLAPEGRRTRDDEELGLVVDGRTRPIFEVRVHIPRCRVDLLTRTGS